MKPRPVDQAVQTRHFRGRPLSAAAKGSSSSAMHRDRSVRCGSTAGAGRWCSRSSRADRDYADRQVDSDPVVDLELCVRREFLVAVLGQGIAAESLLHERVTVSVRPPGRRLGCRRTSSAAAPGPLVRTADRDRSVDREDLPAPEAVRSRAIDPVEYELITKGLA